MASSPLVASLFSSIGLVDSVAGADSVSIGSSSFFCSATGGSSGLEVGAGAGGGGEGEGEGEGEREGAGEDLLLDRKRERRAESRSRAARWWGSLHDRQVGSNHQNNIVNTYAVKRGDIHRGSSKGVGPVVYHSSHSLFLLDSKSTLIQTGQCI